MSEFSGVDQSFLGWLTTHTPTLSGRTARPPRIMVAAFEGWSDAGDVATDALEEIARQTNAELISELNQDDFYDYQVTRPVVTRNDDGTGQIAWPRTRVLHSVAGHTHPDQPELYLVLGTEPSLRWRYFVKEIMEYAEEWDVDAIVVSGALLADVPHSRPLTPSKSSASQQLRDALEGFAKPTYEGPTGITGVLTDESMARGWPTISTWVTVPHYVAQAPSPKALLALLKEFEELLGLRLDLKSLADDAAAWERGVDELAGEDPDVAAYIQQLEEARDTEKLPEASGEQIAKEFERYLKRRDEGGGSATQGGGTR
ncbi:filament polymerization regulator ParJ [Yaniella flava]|uniref:Filament polymerization regulator ParJ n=1 Tax=Yaniella flava TaxID=287930 RepID=A0ABP5G3F4_9MICC|nr:PAC2 family protein [Micrococcaceae bacterium]